MTIALAHDGEWNFVEMNEDQIALEVERDGMWQLDYDHYDDGLPSYQASTADDGERLVRVYGVEVTA